MARAFPAAVTDGLMDSAIVAENHFDDNFEKGGFQGDSFKRWEPNSEFTVSKKGHDTVLHETGNLRRSKKTIMGNLGGKKSASIWYSAIGKNGVDYAPLMQNGFTTSNKPKTWVRNAPVPARPFIGGSKKLDGRIKMTLYSRIGMVFKRNYTIGR
jgi:hypothetical protein